MQPFIGQWQKAGIEVVLVTTDSPARIKEFLAKNSLDFTVLLDDRGQVARLYRVSGIPDGLLIDRQGTLLYRSLGWGPGSLEKLQAAIDKVLGSN
ncbi:MAG: TlpA family protein disulfide reductase [Clostridia bacterium]|nr:TlpA family protein disulfide reductase [Clostridia bacterium]